MFHINSNKLKYVGFGIDPNFGGTIQIYFQNSIETIFYLFDDFFIIKLLVDIAKQKSDLKFLFLTNLKFDEKKLPDNINLIRGSWKIMMVITILRKCTKSINYNHTS